MASYTNRGTKHKPSWQYTISRYVNGKYEPIRKGGFRSKGEAQTEAEEIERRLKHGETIFLEAIPFEEYFQKWYKRYKNGLEKQTLRHYKYTHGYIKDHFLDKAIQKITRDDYQDFLNELGKKYSKETTSKVHSHIKDSIDYALEDGLVQIDFTRKVSITGKPGKNKHEKFLHLEESEKLYNELFNRLDLGLSYYACLLLLVSGLRYEELVGLTRNDFNFKNNTISVNKTWGYNKNMQEGFGPTKNEQSVRTIGIDPDVMKEFKKLFLKMPDNIHRLAFFSATSKYKVITNTAVNKSLKKTLDDLGIENKITPHGLRHTHASSLIFKKAAISFISERLGHSNPDITYRRYSHVIKELKDQDEGIAVNLYRNV